MFPWLSSSPLFPPSSKGKISLSTWLWNCSNVSWTTIIPLTLALRNWRMSFNAMDMKVVQLTRWMARIQRGKWSFKSKSVNYFLFKTISESYLLARTWKGIWYHWWQCFEAASVRSLLHHKWLRPHRSVIFPPWWWAPSGCIHSYRNHQVMLHSDPRIQVSTGSFFSSCCLWWAELRSPLRSSPSWQLTSPFGRQGRNIVDHFWS